MTERTSLIRKLESETELMSAVPIVTEATIECAKLLRRRETPRENEIIPYLLSLKGSDSDFWVAESDGKIVGYTEGHIGKMNSREYFSTYVYVNPENRRSGFGKALKEAQLQRARELGCVYLQTFVDPENEAGLALQKSFEAQLKPLLTSVSSTINL